MARKNRKAAMDDDAVIDELCRFRKLDTLANYPGAFPAEAENARAKADALRTRPKPPGKYDPPPLPSLEELVRRRKGASSARPVNDAAEVARLKRVVARLKQELAEARAKPAIAKVGRKPIGERAMTAAERMRKMRSRRK